MLSLVLLPKYNAIPKAQMKVGKVYVPKHVAT